MTVFRWIIAILASLSVGYVWYITNGNINVSEDSLHLTASVLKGVIGFFAIFSITALLTRDKRS